MNLCDETIKFIGGNLGFMQINVNDSFGVRFILGWYKPYQLKCIMKSLGIEKVHCRGWR